MTTERITITLESTVLAYARAQAEEAGLSLSAWINSVTEKERKLHNGLRAVDTTLDEIGPIRPEVEIWAEEIAAAAFAGADQEMLDTLTKKLLGAAEQVSQGQVSQGQVGQGQVGQGEVA